MKIVIEKTYAILLVGIILPLVSISQTLPSGPCSICNAIVIQDKINSSSSLYQKIKYYESIDQVTFSKIKTEASTGGGILDIITASTDYKTYQENLAKYKKEVNYDGLTISSNDYSSSTTNPIVYQAWSDCITKNCSSLAFNAWLVEENDNVVTFKMRYTYDGRGDLILRVRITIKENEKVRTEFKDINPGGDIPYTIYRQYDASGNSKLHVVVQPVNKSGKDIHDGLTFGSIFFRPIISISRINVEYIKKTKSLVFCHDQLNAPSMHEKDYPYCPNMPIGFKSCTDGKYCAAPLIANINADANCYFENSSDLNLINFVAKGPGAAHNQGQLSGKCKSECAIITASSPKNVTVRFAGSSGLETSWEVSREQTKEENITVPLIFYYVDKNNVNFSLPTAYLVENYKIVISTPYVGSFVITRETEGTIPFSDSNGIRYYKLHLPKLLEPQLKGKLMYFQEK